MKMKNEPMIMTAPNTKASHDKMFFRFIVKCIIFDYERLFPHFGQNFEFGGNMEPHRLHVSLAITCFPQLPQKVLPGVSGALQ